MILGLNIMIQKNKLNFLICSPRQGAGGPIVLHALCQKLQSMGYDARIFIPYWPIFSGNKSRPLFWFEYFIGLMVDESKVLIKRLLGKKLLFLLHKGSDGVLYCPVKGCRRQWLPFVDDNTIVVYPEIVRGNPLNAKHVVRWLLFYYKYLDDPQAYNKSDVFIAYRKQFDCPKINPEGNLVQVTFFDADLYRQTNFGKRSGCCYIVRKGKNRPDLPKTFDGPVIDIWPDEKKVEAFNRYKICYFYDTQTFYASIAAVCGCIPVVVMEKGCTVDSYRKGTDSRAGVAYGEDDISRALATRDELLEQLDFGEANTKAVKNFLRIIQKNFKVE